MWLSARPVEVTKIGSRVGFWGYQPKVDVLDGCPLQKALFAIADDFWIPVSKPTLR